MATRHHKDGVLVERLGPFYWPLFSVLLTVTAIGTLFSGVAMASGHDHMDDDQPATVIRADAACTSSGNAVRVDLGRNGWSQRRISAHLCDVLTVHNTGTDPEKVAWGQHEKHLTYPGYTERVLEPGQTLQIVLRAAGDFPLHDHFSDEHTATIHISK